MSAPHGSREWLERAYPWRFGRLVGGTVLAACTHWGFAHLTAYSSGSECGPGGMPRCELHSSKWVGRVRIRPRLGSITR